MCGIVFGLKYFVFAPMVKWISQRSSEPLFQVRVLIGAQIFVSYPSFDERLIRKRLL